MTISSFVMVSVSSQFYVILPFPALPVTPVSVFFVRSLSRVLH